MECSWRTWSCRSQRLRWASILWRDSVLYIWMRNRQNRKMTTNSRNKGMTSCCCRLIIIIIIIIDIACSFIIISTTIAVKRQHPFNNSDFYLQWWWRYIFCVPCFSLWKDFRILMKLWNPHEIMKKTKKLEAAGIGTNFHASNRSMDLFFISYFRNKESSLRAVTEFYVVTQETRAKATLIQQLLVVV